jgi:hypothetical protein
MNPLLWIGILIYHMKKITIDVLFSNGKKLTKVMD